MPRLARSLLLAFALLAGPAAAQQTGPLDGIVAVVGENVILRSDVEALALQFTRGGAVTTELRRAALNELINQNTLVEHAKRDTTITVSPDEVNEVLDQRTEALVQQLGGEDQVVQLYGRSLAQIREDFRKPVRDQLLAQTLQRRKYFAVRVTPQEVRAWFDAIPPDSIPDVPALVRLAHIVRFPEVNPEARAEAQAKIAAIRDSVTAGTPIEDLARRHSEDPGSAQRGGRYERVNVRDLVPEFGAVAATTAPDELSQVFETQFGFHVLRLNARTGDVVDFNHVLVRVDASSTDPTRAIETLAMLRDSVVTAGASFARLAREFSEDPLTSARGGNVVVPQTGDRDLRLEALDPSWRRTVDTLAVGEISHPTQATLLDGQQAYHIVMLQRRQEPHKLSLETDYTLIQDFALQDKRQRELEAWVEELRGSVYIAIKDDTLRPPGFAG
jgi:peptidyl-prolyl cis-trans isomerase SurA